MEKISGLENKTLKEIFEKSPIKGRMPGDLKAPGMYYEKVILLLTSARLIK